MTQPLNIQQAMELATRFRYEGKLPDAERVVRQVAAACPTQPEVLNELAMIIGSQDRLDEAESLLRQILAFAPGYLRAWQNLAVVAERRGQYPTSVEILRHALQLAPADAHTHHRLGTALKHAGRFDEGFAAVKHALSLAPDDAEIRGTFANYALLLGDYAAGLPAYEARWKCDSFAGTRRDWTAISDPTQIRGKHVAVYAEQGFGDMIQICRYLPLLSQHEPSQLTVTLPAELQTLLSWLPTPFRSVSARNSVSADILLSMMSLPLLFATRLDTIPSTVPYLFTPAPLVEKWRRRIEPYAGTFKIGIAWAGRPEHKQDRERSLRLEQFLPLASLPNVTFFSLQKGPAAAEANPPPKGMTVVNLTAGLADFADTAGFVSNLDLVLSVDTSLVHLAGALGKPVWTLLATAPDWRWLLNRDDSPWYPTMRLFRQRTLGDWPEVFTRVRAALEPLTRK